MASPTLASDIITNNILTRLPSKTLIRFKSVSKQWYSLINSPNFIHLHLTQTLISQNPPNLIISKYSLSSVAIPDETNPNFHLIELDHPLKHLCDNRTRFPQILGSVNGIVCISLYDKSSVVLYNPSTKTYRFIPPFTPSPNTNPLVETNAQSTNGNVVLFGFGFDSVSGDYKLLRMIETHKNRMPVYREASVYSLKNDSWKCVDDQTMTGQFFFQNGMGVFVNESLHFIAADTNFIPKIKCFNLGTETFSTFDLPIKNEKSDEICIRKHFYMNELGGCVGLLVNYQYVTPDFYFLVLADLWVMKEYGNEESWFRLFRIHDPADRLGDFVYLRPVVYSRDKERVLLELDNTSFGWYSWESKSFEKITLHGGPSGYAPYETWTFVDSLVSIGKDKDKDTSKAKIVPKKIKNNTSRGFERADYVNDISGFEWEDYVDDMSEEGEGLPNIIEEDSVRLQNDELLEFLQVEWYKKKDIQQSLPKSIESRRALQRPIFGIRWKSPEIHTIVKKTHACNFLPEPEILKLKLHYMQQERGNRHSPNLNLPNKAVYNPNTTDYLAPILRLEYPDLDFPDRTRENWEWSYNKHLAGQNVLSQQYAIELMLSCHLAFDMANLFIKMRAKAVEFALHNNCSLYVPDDYPDKFQMNAVDVVALMAKVLGPQFEPVIITIVDDQGRLMLYGVTLFVDKYRNLMQRLGDAYKCNGNDLIIF